MKAKAIFHTGITVSNLDRTASFLKEWFGMVEVERKSFGDKNGEPWDNPVTGIKKDLDRRLLPEAGRGHRRALAVPVAAGAAPVLYRPQRRRQRPSRLLRRRSRRLLRAPDGAGLPVRGAHPLQRRRRRKTAGRYFLLGTMTASATSSSIGKPRAHSCPRAIEKAMISGRLAPSPLAGNAGGRTRRRFRKECGMATQSGKHVSRHGDPSALDAPQLLCGRHQQDHRLLQPGRRDRRDLPHGEPAGPAF